MTTRIVEHRSRPIECRTDVLSAFFTAFHWNVDLGTPTYSIYSLLITHWSKKWFILSAFTRASCGSAQIDIETRSHQYCQLHLVPVPNPPR